MKLTIYLLSLITLILGGVAVALRLWPALGMPNNTHERRFGLFENRELVGRDNGSGTETYSVEDKDCRQLFIIPLRNCIIDSRYRNGRLSFREKTTGREGYIDKQGIVTFLDKQTIASDRPKSDGQTLPKTVDERQNGTNDGATQSPAVDIGAADMGRIAKSSPFYKEALKVLSGNLSEEDTEKRRVILNYCEHFRAAYVTKDIDFLRQVFSEKALIIVGSVVKTKQEDAGKYLSGDRVAYNLRTKKDYIARLSKAFAANKQVDVRFSGFRIMRHPTIKGIYGVSLRQQYKSDSYSDDGWLFLLWDFRNESMPLIHVRTWQPSAAVSGSDDIINLMDFNFE